MHSLEMAEEDEAEPTVVPVDVGSLAEETIRQRITHVLSIYPKLSHSMLQVGIGTGLPPALWHPILDRMVHDGSVQKNIIKATNPATRREQVYTIIQAAA